MLKSESLYLLEKDIRFNCKYCRKTVGKCVSLGPLGCDKGKKICLEAFLPKAG
jgi:hypothetical protein